MTINRKQFDIGMCPSPGQQKGRGYRTPVALRQTYDADTNRITVEVFMLREGMNPPDLVYDLFLCPQGQACGCSYEADVEWEIDSTLCMADASWTWPAATGCLLKSGSLSGSKSGTHFTEELEADPDWEIYSINDIRNPECPGCGMSDQDRETTMEIPVPGEQLTLTGCIDEETCIDLYGAQGCYPLGSVRYETVGFMGGPVVGVADESSRLYRIQIGDVVVEVYGCDMTEYEVGDWVALAKPGTEFPVDEFEHRVPVTNSNVPTVETTDYTIVPYQFAGVS